MSLKFNKQSIVANYSMLKNDGVLTIDAAGVTLDLPSFDDIGIKDGKYFYIIANESYNIQTVDGVSVLNISGGSTYTVPQFQHAKITYIAGEWYFTIYDVTSGGGGGGTVTSVDAVGTQGVTVAGVPFTTSGTISIGLGAITPTSVAATGTVTGSNLSGTNTGNVTLAGLTYLSIAGQVITAAAINLATMVTGNLPVTNLNSGTGASATTFWRGDGTWGTPAGTATPPGGSSGQFQYNNAGIFGGAAELTYSAGVVTAIDSRFRIADNSDPTKLIAFEASGLTTGTTRTYSGPDATGILVLEAASQTISNKVFDNSNRYISWDSRFTLQDNADNTKIGVFELSGITTATTRTLTWPNVSGTIITSGDTGTVSTTMIANDAVTLAKLVNATTNNRLLGRATAGAGDWEEITLGTNLSFTGTTLNASGGGTPGGSTTEVQFNNAGAFDGDANFIWDDTNSQLGLLGNGTAALPTLAISGTNIGIYRPAIDTLGFTTAGALRFNLDATSLRSNTTGGGIVRSAAGAVGTPTFSFQGDTNTGIWNSAPDTIAFSCSGATQFGINDVGSFFGPAAGSVYLKSAAGTAALPTYCFVNDVDTGFYSNAANTIKWSTAGGQRGSIDSVGRMFVGTTTAPTAWVHVAATTTVAGTGGLKFTSGALMTTAEAGAVEFVTDDLYFTITTGAARKNITLWDTLGTSGRVPFATTNGRLTDSANLVYTSGTGLLVSDNIKLQAAGNGFYVKEGTNATMGIATLVAGTVVVNTTKVTANSRIFLTHQNNSGTLGEVTVSARTAGTSFTITSLNVLDTSDIAWIIIEPA